MNVTFKELKKSILRSLDDEIDENLASTGGSTYSPELLMDAVHAALNAITQRVWKRAVADIEADAEDFELPEGVIDIDGVYEKKLGVFIPRVSFQLGATMTSPTGNGWYMYPTGYITFLNKIGSSGGKLFYETHWTKPQNDSETIESPEITKTCLILFACSYCLFPPAASSADIRQFNTKVDSGQPGDIPAKQMSDFFLKRFEEELKRIPMMEKGRTQ